MKKLARTWLLAVVIGAVGCIDVAIDGEVRKDGSGMLRVTYIVIDDFFTGRYAELDNSKVLPLTEADIQKFVSSLPGAVLVYAEVKSLGEQKTGLGRKYSLSRVHYQFAFADINEIATNHFRFAYYPKNENQYFQFRVDKSMPPPGDIPDARPNVNPLAHALTQDRFIRLTIYLPDRILRSNGDMTAAPTVRWELPMSEILAGRLPSLVAWAEMPQQSEQGALAQLRTFFLLDSWKNPENFDGAQNWAPVTAPIQSFDP